jgi:inner membrane protein
LHRYLRGCADFTARLSASRLLSLGLITAIVPIDRLTSFETFGFASRALVDEPCHLATAVIALGALVRWHGRIPPPAFTAAMLAASVLIDLDHLPAQFGTEVLVMSTPRPCTHALWVVVLLSVVALAAWYRSRRTAAGRAAALAVVSAGAAAGVAVHFLRDVATAPISLWWPVTDAGLQVPYWWYAAAMLVLVAVPVRRRRLRPPDAPAAAGLTRTGAQAA